MVYTRNALDYAGNQGRFALELLKKLGGNTLNLHTNMKFIVLMNAFLTRGESFNLETTETWLYTCPRDVSYLENYPAGEELFFYLRRCLKDELKLDEVRNILDSLGDQILSNVLFAVSQLPNIRISLE